MPDHEINLNEEDLVDLMNILSDLYFNTPEARKLLRKISKQTGEHTEIVAEMDSEFPEEKDDL